jgi:hypothetical protein
MLAFAETVPDVFAQTHPELRRIAAFVDGTRTIEAVSAPFELVEKFIVLKDLLHGDGRFDGPEIDKQLLWHSFPVVMVNCEELVRLKK